MRSKKCTDHFSNTRISPPQHAFIVVSMQLLHISRKIHRHNTGITGTRA